MVKFNSLKIVNMSIAAAALSLSLAPYALADPDPRSPKPPVEHGAGDPGAGEGAAALGEYISSHCYEIIHGGKAVTDAVAKQFGVKPDLVTSMQKRSCVHPNSK
ncbi:MAG: hypothetical protein ACRC20_10295 [Segniliparus sp.]|uniref:hypothetical protein n=1 Tax=Segniliparus sp. TaxID=2804064 RepID=UPI003F30B76D